jgi:chromosome partition protein MukE
MSELDESPIPLDSDPVSAAGPDPEGAQLSKASYHQLEDVILDESFPEVDLALRRGRHIHKGDERWYEFLLEAREYLEAFYRRFGCELEQRSDGYFFLLPVTDVLGKRHLGVPEMIVGQGLALCYLDPRSVQSGGVVAREELLNQLAAVMGTDALMRTLNPKRKRVDERVMQRTVRQKVNEALRRLSQLGFVELLDGEQLRLAPSLMRFAEPVRGLDAPSEALKRLIERGEVSLGPGDAEPEARDADDLDAEVADAEGTLAEALDEDRPDADASDANPLRAEPAVSIGGPAEAEPDIEADAEPIAGVTGDEWFDDDNARLIAPPAPGTGADAGDADEPAAAAGADTSLDDGDDPLAMMGAYSDADVGVEADGGQDADADEAVELFVSEKAPASFADDGEPPAPQASTGYADDAPAIDPLDADALDADALRERTRDDPSGPRVAPTISTLTGADIEVDWDTVPGEEA